MIMIAVVGATGNTGQAIVKELKQLGHDPICVVRNPDKAREVLGMDTKTVVAELTDQSALESAFKGVTSVFVVTGHNPNMVEQQNRTMCSTRPWKTASSVELESKRYGCGPS